MPELTRGAARLSYQDSGVGKPVVLIHGTGASAATWGDASAELSTTHRVLKYDRRGFGKSTGITRSLSVHSADAAALIAAADSGPATVVGWSSGGTIALHLAHSWPDLVASLVLVEAPVHPPRHSSPQAALALLTAEYLRLIRRDERAGARAVMRWALGYTTGGTAFDRWPTSWQDDSLADAESILREARQGIGFWPRRAAISTLTCPVTLVGGTLSDPMFRRTERTLMAWLPQAERVLISGAGHAVHLDRPDEWLDAIRHGVAKAHLPG